MLSSHRGLNKWQEIYMYIPKCFLVQGVISPRDHWSINNRIKSSLVRRFIDPNPSIKTTGVNENQNWQSLCLDGPHLMGLWFWCRSIIQHGRHTFPHHWLCNWSDTHCKIKQNLAGFHGRSGTGVPPPFSYLGRLKLFFLYLWIYIVPPFVWDILDPPLRLLIRRLPFLIKILVPIGIQHGCHCRTEFHYCIA